MRIVLMILLIMWCDTFFTQDTIVDFDNKKVIINSDGYQMNYFFKNDISKPVREGNEVFISTYHIDSTHYQFGVFNTKVERFLFDFSGNERKMIEKTKYKYNHDTLLQGWVKVFDSNNKLIEKEYFKDNKKYKFVLYSNNRICVKGYFTGELVTQLNENNNKRLFFRGDTFHSNTREYFIFLELYNLKEIGEMYIKKRNWKYYDDKGNIYLKEVYSRKGYLKKEIHSKTKVTEPCTNFIY